MRQPALLISLLTSFVVAQDGSSITSSAASSSATASINSSYSSNATSTSTGIHTHTVNVAQGGFTFVPDVTLANVGDIIEFDFFPTNHSVIRAEYKFPCVPYELTGVDKVGFYSGFQPVDAILPNPPKFQIRVNDSNPIFYYCGAEGSCINYQMVGVINPNASTSLQTQKQLASQSTFMLLPGQKWPEEDPNPFATTTGSPSTTATDSAATSTGTAAAATSSGSSTLSGGAIAGIAIGGAAVLLAAAVLIYFCGRASRRNNAQQSAMAHHQSHVPFVPPPPNVTYADPAKHMSMQSGYASPALPGYVPQHDPAMSPPLHSTYPVSDALNPGSDRGPGSPSLSQGFDSPIHPSMYGNSMHGTPRQSAFSQGPPPGVHEMAAPEAQQQSGIMGFIRRSSLSKSGGVERYG